VENAEAVRAFLDEQHRFQARTAASIRADPKLAEQASPETIAHNRLLIAALDQMSLEICRGVKEEIKIPNVPTVGAGTTELRMQPRAGEGLVLDDLVLDPWPFRTAASRSAPKESACAGGSRRRQTSIGRWTRPTPHW
jgi:uncharacterized protein DUF3891